MKTLLIALLLILFLASAAFAQTNVVIYSAAGKTVYRDVTVEFADMSHVVFTCAGKRYYHVGQYTLICPDYQVMPAGN